MKNIKYSEIFYSMQGEGYHTGVPTVWLRFWGCNLNCEGFGQKEPTDRDKYILPYKLIDTTNIKKLEDLPVFNYGCDSSYSWASKFKHLAHKATVTETVDKLLSLLPNKMFFEEKMRFVRDTHLAFTGGEPMLWQDSMVDVINEMIRRDNFPVNITCETNGTKEINDNLLVHIRMWQRDFGIRWLWSISPKLYNVSGEKDAVDLENIADYADNCHFTQLKFVLNNTNEAWKEVDDYVLKFDEECAWSPTVIYIMPVGATIESQTGTINIDLAEIADKALARGWCVSGRLHATIYSNTIGT